MKAAREARGGRGITEVDEGIAQAVVLVETIHRNIDKVVLTFEAHLVKLLLQGGASAPVGDVPQHQGGERGPGGITDGRGSAPLKSMTCKRRGSRTAAAAAGGFFVEECLQHQLGLEYAGDHCCCVLIK